MDFNVGADGEEFRAEVKRFMAEAIPPEKAEHHYRTGTLHDEDFLKALGEKNWLGGGWKSEFGGNDLTPWQLRIIDEEFLYNEAPTYAYGTTMSVARAVADFGSQELKDEIIAKAYTGEIVIAYGFTEPESGSDVASAQLRAVRDGEDWVLNGSKMFTTNAHVADYVFVLARTNLEAPKHRGLSLFVVPTNLSGFECQAVWTVSNERTNITYYSDMRVPDKYRVGEVDGGWKVMTATLQEEHTAGFGGTIFRLLHAAEIWAKETIGLDGRPRIEDPDVKSRLARCAADAEVSLLIQRRALWMAEQGQVPVSEGPMAKLYSSEAIERAAQDLFEMMGPDGVRAYYDPTAPAEGKVEHLLRFSIGTTIYAGASEVQRNIIAGMGLGLPRG
jgi:alkylation response protein AidB-like acyl-CoA dehydrogenase